METTCCLDVVQSVQRTGGSERAKVVFTVGPISKSGMGTGWTFNSIRSMGMNGPEWSQATLGAGEARLQDAKLQRTYCVFLSVLLWTVP